MKSTAQQVEDRDVIFSAMDIAMPFYTKISHRDLSLFTRTDEKDHNLRQNAFAGKTPQWIFSAQEQLLKTGRLADQWIMNGGEKLLDEHLWDLDDFSLCALSCLSTEFHGDDPQVNVCIDNMDRAALLMALDPSRPGSPFVDYDLLFSDVLGYDMINDDKEHFETFSRAIAHNFSHSSGQGVLGLLSHMGRDMVRAGRSEEGIALMCDVILFSPRRFDAYNELAYALSNAGHGDLAIQVADRTALLARLLKDYFHESEDLRFTLRDTGLKPKPPTAQISMMVSQALSTSFNTARNKTLHGLAQKYLPPLNQIPVKIIPQI